MTREALTKPALDALLQAPSLAVLAVDKQGCVILWSPSASMMFGWTESEVLGRFLPIVPEDERQVVYDRIQGELKGENAIAREVRRLRKDGSLVDISFWTAPLLDNKGEVIGVLGLCADISARKRAEGALQPSEAELQRVLAAVSDYIYSGEFDSDGRFFYHYYSPAVERIMGRPPLFFLAGPEQWLSTVHLEDRPRLVQAFARLQTGQSSSEEEEYRIVLPDRAIRWVRDSVVVSQGTDGRRFVNGVVSDITARKQTEQALRQSELELRRVLSATSDYFWSGDADREGRFHYRYYSPAVERITGRPAEFYMAGSERWMSTVHPEDRARISEISEQLLSGKSVSNENEHRIVLPDGTIRWVRANVTVSPLADGHRRFDGVVSDITARRQSEEALRESELELRRVLGAASDYFWSGDIDPEGRFLYRYYSPAVERITGRPAEFYMAGSERWMSTVHPEDRARISEISEQLLSGELVSHEYTYRIVLPDGTIRWVLSKTTVSPPVDGHRRVDGVVSDITARKKTEAALQETDKRLQEQLLELEQLYKFSPVGLYALDRDLRFLRINEQLAEIDGISVEEHLGRTIHEVVPKLAEELQKLWQPIFETGEPILNVEVSGTTAKAPGALRHWLCNYFPMKAATGEVTGLMAAIVEITERKRTEEALGRAHDELEERVQERTAELVISNAALRESEIKFRTLVEELPAVTYIAALDEAHTKMYVSPQVQSVLGFTPTEYCANPNVWRQHIHPDDLKRVMAEVRRTHLKGEPFDCEYRMLHRTGEIVWIRDKAAVVRNEAGQPLFLQGVKLDVTERHQAEEIMGLQSVALTSAANGIVITDREGHVAWVNPAFTKLTGYELSEVIGKDLRVLRSGQHATAFYQNLWQTPLSGKVWHGEIVNKRKDGSLYTEEMTITPVRDAAGEIAHFIAIKQDITERKSAEEARRHLAAIVESTNDAIISANLDGIVTSWNAAAQRLFNYAPEEIVGRSLTVLIPPNRRSEAMQLLKKVRDGERIHVETVRLKKRRIPVHVAITVSPIKNDAGQIIGTSAVIRDTTERKELEQAVVEASSREQKRIGQDLHDSLCQQLTGIGFLWKAIVQRKEVRALLDAATVKEVSQLITKTIGEARDLARGLCPVELERNDLGVALKNLGLSMERLFAVSCVVRCQQLVRLADKTVATHLYRIAQEAVNNAVHHGKAARVWIHFVSKKNQLTLRVRDNGSGFSKGRGFKEGIGMRSMRYRAQVIGGSLTIESQRGAGANVTCVCTQPRRRSAGEARRHTPG